MTDHHYQTAHKHAHPRRAPRMNERFQNGKRCTDLSAFTQSDFSLDENTY